MNRSTKDLLLQSRDPIPGLLREQSVVLSKLEKNADKEIEENDNLAEWHEVAFIMDRIFLFFYVFATLLTSIIFLAKMTSDSQ